MFYSNQISEIRKFYIQAWQKYQNHLELTGLEIQICEVIKGHPEYHQWLSDQHLDTHFHPEIQGSNPFMHMGLHLALIEQIQTDRPQGIREIYQKLLKQYPSSHDVEHAMIEILAYQLWDAQKNQQAPDEKQYLLQCRQLIKLQR